MYSLSWVRLAKTWQMELEEQPQLTKSMYKQANAGAAALLCPETTKCKTLIDTALHRECDLVRASILQLLQHLHE